MSDHHDLLIEIGTEELPASSLNTLAHDLATAIDQGLQQAGLSHASRTVYATPRRIAVLYRTLPATQPDRVLERRGPSVRVALDHNGELTKAGAGFARSLGINADQLERSGSGDNERLLYRAQQPGHSTRSLIPALLNTALADLSTHTFMRWGHSKTAFVRPVHWVVLLLDGHAINTEILGVRSGAITYGHRFHAPDELRLTQPTEYEERLRQAHVIAAFDEREQIIGQYVVYAAGQLQGEVEFGNPSIKRLLAENAALTEWPVVVIGHFDDRFLALPKSIIEATLINHQRYFPVKERGSDKLLPYFIAISNIDSSNIDSSNIDSPYPNIAISNTNSIKNQAPNAVRDGNERVIRPRLEDAEFFYQTDCETTLADRLAALDPVMFHEQLGTLGDKAKRIAEIAEDIALNIQPNSDGIDQNLMDQAYRAGLLCKCDLNTKMVGEFPELQGIIGGEYARINKEDPAVAEAISETYLPRFAGDRIPRTAVGIAVALADKLDTLVGFFNIGQIPTGNKDPFALRRAAIGILRIILETDTNSAARFELHLMKLLEEAIKISVSKEVEKVEQLQYELVPFLTERLRSYVVDHRHIPVQVFNAALHHSIDLAHLYKNDGYDKDMIYLFNPPDLLRRVEAIDSFRNKPEARSLVAANKRIANILRKNKDEIDRLLTMDVDSALFTTDPERTLHQCINDLSPKVLRLSYEGNYRNALMLLATLRRNVDVFFDTVKVMDDDKQVSDNRLALLLSMQRLFMKIGDISHLQSLIGKTTAYVAINT